MFDLSHVNLVAILVAALANMAIGFIWYQKAVFGGAWAKYLGKDMVELGSNPAIYLVNLGVYLLMAYVLAQVIFYFGIITAFEGSLVGAVMWLGFIGAASVIENLFSQRPWKLWAINYGYSLVALIIMGAILGFWQ